MGDHKELSQSTQNGDQLASDAPTPPTERKPFVSPTLVRFGDLPIITAGSIDSEAWGFEEV